MLTYEKYLKDDSPQPYQFMHPATKQLYVFSRFEVMTYLEFDNLKNRMRWMKGSVGRGKYLEMHLVGEYQDGSGRLFNCFAPVGLEMSVWVRLEPHDGKRAEFIYDADGSFKRDRVNAHSSK